MDHASLEKAGSPRQKALNSPQAAEGKFAGYGPKSPGGQFQPRRSSVPQVGVRNWLGVPARQSISGRD